MDMFGLEVKGFPPFGPGYNRKRIKYKRCDDGIVCRCLGGEARDSVNEGTFQNVLSRCCALFIYVSNTISEPGE